MSSMIDGMSTNENCFQRLLAPGALFASAVSFSACAGKTQADASAELAYTHPVPTVPPRAAGSTTASSPASSPWVLSSTSPIGQEVLSCIDPTINPCDDFFTFACGGWLARTSLPPDKPSYGRGFGELRDRNVARLRQILENSAKSTGERGFVGRYYASCMDEVAIEEAALTPLHTYLDAIDRVDSVADALHLAGMYHASVLANVFFSAYLDNDFKNPDLYLLTLSQGGLGLPDRDYYLESRHQSILNAYQENLGKLLTLAGLTFQQAAASAAAVVAFEGKLARIAKPLDELRDPETIYHLTKRRDLDRLADLDWKTYLRAAKISFVDTINVAVPPYFEALPGILAATETAVLRDYLRAHAMMNLAPRLNKASVDIHFELTRKISGAKTNKPRWERCVDTTTEQFPDVVARAYVEKYFASDSRASAVQMIQDIEAAFVEGLPKLTWMDEATRSSAIGKVQAITNKIGFPDKWQSYTGIQVGQNYLKNSVHASEARRRRDFAKIGKRVDRKEWVVPASIVDAFYNPLQNEMVFPAGILQPPYFSTAFPKAMNYGAMGMIMGHELIHGFDDMGRKFDGSGVMHEWWSPLVSERFEERAMCIEKSYAAIEIQPGLKINGKLTLGENIADHGGIKESFNAYQLYVQSHGAEAPIISGLTNNQLLFVAYAQMWCVHRSPEFARLALTVDPHSPPKERVNLPLAHLPPFWEAFDCGSDTKMHASDTCEVW